MSDIIPIDSEITTFSDYLDRNCRCILSARFGDGKSFFLNEFKKKTFNKYIFLTIYPVNYQVAENKDIFEYIKRDILLQILMTSAVDLSGEKYGFALRLWGFLNQNGKDLVSDIIALAATSLANIPQTSMTILRDNIVKFKAFSKEANKSESDNIESYLDEFTRQKGGIYEFDPISQIIYQLITDIKTQSGKQVVLVIEDMDRIDPAHIFRILNVFSAHWDIRDYSEQKLTSGDPLNKYNFDKILLVCHFQNIKNIFHHFYGVQTDFTGYIHKFTSSTPYEYSLADVIEEWLVNKIPFNREIFPDICKYLAVLIMRQYEKRGDIVTNIRHITNVILSPNYAIKEERIPHYNWQYGYNGFNFCISTINQVTRLLCVLRNFDISIDEFFSARTVVKDEDAFHQQLCRFIGHCWLIYPQLGAGSNCQFSFSNVENNSIKLGWDNSQALLLCKTKQIASNALVRHYEIEYMDITRISNSDMKKIFSWKVCQKILYFFDSYIY